MSKSASEEVELIWLLVTSISVGLLLAISLIMFVVFYQRRLNNHKMHLQRLENEHKHKLMLANIEIQEMERTRIARDLHDEVGAVLSTTNMFLGHLLTTNDTEAVVNKIKTLISMATQKLRSISHNITPQNLKEFGLVKAIEEICSKLNDTELIKIDFEYHTDSRFNVSEELNLYRIVQELLNNTIKHAEATVIVMNLSILPNIVTFSYTDNGKGVNLESVHSRQRLSLGMSNLETRAEALNTKIYLQSSPNQGFSANISFSPTVHEYKKTT